MTKPSKNHPARVLFVDDEPELTSSLRLALRREPFRISTADSGAAALALLERDEFDVVVSDERMPGMLGSEFLTQVRERWPRTIRITLSGQSSLESAVRAINEAGIQRFLLKPCPAEEIALTIHELLEARTDVDADSALRSQPRRLLNTGFEAALSGLWMGFQPVLRVDRSVFGYEALLRTEATELRTPLAILTAADELERGRDLGRAVRAAVAERAGEAPPGTSLLVNLDTGDLGDPELYDASGALAQFAAQVVLEVTERRPLSGLDDLEERLDRLRGLGYRIALDDLGAGYSGLNHLTRLSPDIVKFDMELIRGIDRSPTKRAIMESMTLLSKKMGIQTIAEGIERESELEVVEALGCDMLQGFLFGSAQRQFMGPSSYPLAA
ncbi:MAG: EAL domain-containing protein [Planctomycetota bacterium]